MNICCSCICKNDYNCIFLPPKLKPPGWPALRYFVWVMSYYLPPEPIRFKVHRLPEARAAVLRLSSSTSGGADSHAR